MLPHTEIVTDVLVIGGGIAGFFAAIKAREQGLDVLVTDKGYAGKAGAGYASGMGSMVYHADLGLNLGLAFQVQDDLLGIWGDEQLIGKSVSSDITTRKKTLPVLYGLSHSPDLRALYGKNGPQDEFVRRAVALLDESGARAYAVAEAERYTTAALANLDAAAPTGPAAVALRQLTDILLQRNY